MLSLLNRLYTHGQKILSNSCPFVISKGNNYAQLFVAFTITCFILRTLQTFIISFNIENK